VIAGDDQRTLCQHSLQMTTQVDLSSRDTRPIPFAGTQPADMRPDLVIGDVIPQDERLWVPLGDGSWSRPLQFDVTHGQYTHVMRVNKTGIIARHRHSGHVLGYVLRGEWHYLEHDWVARAGGIAFEPPGETHTLVVPEGCQEMMTLFQVTGALIYVDPDGVAIGYDDVFTRLERARAHFEAAGLDLADLESMVR
jgi:2,4'-dihydroxyacetophenone dioxygenase